MKVGLFFGSFNPIHLGHLVIANAMTELADLTKVWFVVSPHNPFKEAEGLLNEHDRLRLVHMAVADNPRFEVEDVEFTLNRPSYTYATLQVLKEKYPDNVFDIIIGQDNLSSFDRWEYYEKILAEHRLLVYPRHDAPESPLMNHHNVLMMDAPKFEISATFIRNGIRNNRSVKYLLPDSVEAYIKQNGLYKAVSL